MAPGATSPWACMRPPPALAMQTGLRRFVVACHAAGLGVLLDWVPAHFPTDPHGLASFDGTHLYEHADPREGFHNDWNTLIYNLGRNEVRNYLVGNALYWLECYGVDGLRVDAVASMLYRDYSRKAGEWIPNVHGGRENLESIALLKRMNEVVGTERPSAITLAEESTAFPGVSRPTYSGGLGFHYKWNMGWMHDTLSYIQRDPIHRKYHHERNDLRHGLRLRRKLCAAHLARRSGAWQGLDAGQDAGRRMAKVCQSARLLRLHVGPPRQEAVVHGLRVWPIGRVEPRPEPGLASARTSLSTPACKPGCAT